MSFSKLLASGKSLVGMPDNASRYRMRTQNLLPKFVSPKNPFAQPAPKPAAPAAPATGAARMETAPLFEAERAEDEAAREIKVNMARPSEAVKVEIRQAETRTTTTPPRTRDETINPEVKAPLAAPKERTTNLDFKAPSAPSRTRDGKMRPVKKSRDWFGWIKKLNPLAFLHLGRSSGMASRGRVGKSHVQAELSLDRVQVVRNDLRDTDLEIVPGRLMGMPSGASPILMNSARPDTKGWSRLATQLMGVEQTQI